MVRSAMWRLVHRGNLSQSCSGITVREEGDFKKMTMGKGDDGDETLQKVVDRVGPKPTFPDGTPARDTVLSAADSDVQVLEYFFPSHVGSRSMLTDMWTSSLHVIRGFPGLATPSAWC